MGLLYGRGGRVVRFYELLLTGMVWFIILCMNVVLFGYLLKLVVEYSYLPSDDDDDDDEDDDDDVDVDDEEEAKGSSPRSMS